ncbi:ead/Ea22-like family protein [Klebsiella pneumoniae]
MTTDITKLAQSHELLIANGQQTADLLRHLADNEIDSDYFAVVSECESYGKETDAELSITEFALRAAGYVDALVEALEKAQQVDEELCKLLPPGAEYMDPPDGGDVTPLEGVRRMVADYRQRIAELEPFHTAYMEWSDKTAWVQTDKRFDVLKPWGKHRADVLKEYIQHLESRTVKLPKPHAHLIWIQAGHAPDDYWDDVAVSHSEKDRCCDGSERYPVYARWEIEEMLTAAGIKWEAE